MLSHAWGLELMHLACPRRAIARTCATWGKSSPFRRRWHGCRGWLRWEHRDDVLSSIQETQLGEVPRGILHNQYRLVPGAPHMLLLQQIGDLLSSSVRVHSE